MYCTQPSIPFSHLAVISPSVLLREHWCVAGGRDLERPGELAGRCLTWVYSQDLEIVCGGRRREDTAIGYVAHLVVGAKPILSLHSSIKIDPKTRRHRDTRAG